MRYLGLHRQIKRNNRRSVLLLIAFPLLILIGVYVILLAMLQFDTQLANDQFLITFPVVLVIVGIWFVIAYFTHSKMIQLATHSQPLERRENKRVYNLVENLCMSIGMKMPNLYIIETDMRNAFASGINEKNFGLTLTRGIIDSLTDEELEGVIAHELSHIRNRDVRLLIVTIVFVGIFGVILHFVFRNILYGSLFRRRGKRGGGMAVLLIVLIVTAILYFFSMIFKFALSRSREYMADAGAVSLTKNAPAMASALRKVAGKSKLEVASEEVSELFLDNGKEKTKTSSMAFFTNLFSTHPPIEKRIEVLENW